MAPEKQILPVEQTIPLRCESRLRAKTRLGPGKEGARSSCSHAARTCAYASSCWCATYDPHAITQRAGVARATRQAGRS